MFTPDFLVFIVTPQTKKQFESTVGSELLYSFKNEKNRE